MISKIQELRELVPTNKWSERELNNLLPLIEEEEENYLMSVLGESLFDKIVEDYQSEAFESSSVQGRIIRCCQRIAVYRMMANNSGLFSVSFNPGGGLNMMNTESYEAASQDAIKRFERDAWGKSNRNVESLLIYLEKDSKKDAHYTPAWKKSSYYYYHNKLLFKTSGELELYLSLPTGESRRVYISLVPIIEICQNTYIVPRIGKDVFAKLLSESWHRADITEEEYTEEEKQWHELDQHVRRALANFVANENKNLRTERSIIHADTQIAVAEEMAKRLMSSTGDGENTSSSPTPSETEVRCKHRDYDLLDPSNSVLDLGGLFHS